MSTEETVRSLIEGATPELREALSASAVESLMREATPVLRRLAQNAYEVGFREGLAGASLTPTVVNVAHREELVTAPASGPPAAEVSWNKVDSAGEEGPDPDRSRSLSIFPHATVGTLEERIQAAFGLERFDIDVVICRRGDPNRRQLKYSTRLSAYLIEGK